MSVRWPEQVARPEEKEEAAAAAEV